MISYLPLSAVEVTNQCVVVCDLRKWTGPESPAWQVLRGYQDEVGQNLAALLDISGVRRFDDFGGVCERRHRRPQVQAARFATSSISRDIWRPGRWRGRRSRGSILVGSRNGQLADHLESLAAFSRKRNQPRPIRKCRIESRSPNRFRSHKTTTITTTAFKIDLIDRAIGMYVFTSQRRTPTTISDSAT
jgi:hypothetical protein